MMYYEITAFFSRLLKFKKGGWSLSVLGWVLKSSIDGGKENRVGRREASCLSYNICIRIIYTYILASRCCAHETTELRPVGGGFFFQVDDDI